MIFKIQISFLSLLQCVPESVLGALVGVSAVLGLSGSLTYPALRKRIGLEKTGLFGFASLILCLVMSVVSIWLKGSPFDVHFLEGDVVGHSNNSNRTYCELI